MSRETDSNPPQPAASSSLVTINEVGRTAANRSAAERSDFAPEARLSTRQVTPPPRVV